MRPERILFAMIAGIAACAGSEEQRATATQADSQVPAPEAVLPAVNTAAIAANIVNNSYRVRPGDVIRVSGPISQRELLEDIALEIRKVGGYALITHGSSRLSRLSYDRVPPERDRDAPKLALALVRVFDGDITVDSDESSEWFKAVAPERAEARAVAAQPVGELSRKLQRKFVSLGNAMIPSDDNAAVYGIARAELARQFWAGVNVDYSELAATGNVVRQQLRAGRTVRVTTPAGTDITFALTRADPYISDGVISDDDLRRGSAGRNVWLPAGEVYTLVAPGSGNGVVVAERYPWIGTDVIEGLRVEVKNGRITAISAARGIDDLQRRYQTGSGAKDLLTVLDIGLNPKVRIPAGGVLPYVPAGLVTLFFGDDTWAGGRNTSTFSISPYQTNATLTVDGKTLVQGGVLQVAAAQTATK